MARNTVSQVQHEETAFQWQEHPEEPEERQIAVDPFSLRQFSRLNIDRPLPIPSVSVDHHLHAPAPAPPPPRLASASVPCSAATSPRLSTAVAAPTRWDAHLSVARSATSAVTAPRPASRALSRSRSCAGGETELADDEFNVILSSPERRASAPQRWGSDVPLIADSRGNNGRRKAKHGDEAPFNCCLYLPGLTRRSKPTATTAMVLASSGSATFRRSAAVESDPGTARPSTMSLAVSLERFECGSLSTSSASGLALDGEASSSYFDLPLELILGCDDDEADLPVHAAFMFDSDGIRKSVLKKGVSRAAGRPSLGKVSTDASGTGRMSARHVRFSLTSGSAPTSASS